MPGAYRGFCAVVGAFHEMQKRVFYLIAGGQTQWNRRMLSHQTSSTLWTPRTWCWLPSTATGNMHWHHDSHKHLKENSFQEIHLCFWYWPQMTLRKSNSVRFLMELTLVFTASFVAFILLMTLSALSLSCGVMSSLVLVWHLSRYMTVSGHMPLLWTPWTRYSITIVSHTIPHPYHPFSAVLFCLIMYSQDFVLSFFFCCLMSLMFCISQDMIWRFLCLLHQRLDCVFLKRLRTFFCTFTANTEGEIFCVASMTGAL